MTGVLLEQIQPQVRRAVLLYPLVPQLRLTIARERLLEVVAAAEAAEAVPLLYMTRNLAMSIFMLLVAEVVVEEAPLRQILLEEAAAQAAGQFMGPTAVRVLRAP